MKIEYLETKKILRKISAAFFHDNDLVGNRIHRDEKCKEYFQCAMIYVLQ